MEKPKQENLTNDCASTPSPEELEKLKEKKKEEEKKKWKEEVNKLEEKKEKEPYNMLYKKIFEVFSKEEEAKNYWKKVVEGYDLIQSDPYKEKRDVLIENFMDEKMKELEEIEMQKESEPKES